MLYNKIRDKTITRAVKNAVLLSHGVGGKRYYAP